MPRHAMLMLLWLRHDASHCLRHTPATPIRHAAGYMIRLHVADADAMPLRQRHAAAADSRYCCLCCCATPCCHAICHAMFATASRCR